jgi:LPXTG-site transpeptidase (sortase) family protein
MPISGVPLLNNRWDVTWLGQNAGYLEGTAFPTWQGNTVLTAHVVTSDGLPGPFAQLENLVWGDQIIVHAFGQRYIYQVRTKSIVIPEDFSVFEHREEDWVSLLTCRSFDEASGQYLNRILVEAVLIEITPEP